MTRATVKRDSKETTIQVTLDLEGDGKATVSTGNKFLDHMLETWTRYAGFHLDVQGEGDLDHHLVEDVAIACGTAFREAFDHAPCTRIAHDVVCMDDALLLCAIDLVDRPYYEGDLPIPLYDHWFRSFAMEARINLHFHKFRGRDAHHLVEAAFKSFGRTLRAALAPRDEEISMKGQVELQQE